MNENDVGIAPFKNNNKFGNKLYEQLQLEHLLSQSFGLQYQNLQLS